MAAKKQKPEPKKTKKEKKEKPEEQPEQTKSAGRQLEEAGPEPRKLRTRSNWPR
ncbi:MAG: hypothetical protein HPY46_10530 [Candidatus Aminicenantes bacterium]|nr:hypothetical protein [Candidatus Aminicenantes bacterium]